MEHVGKGCELIQDERYGEAAAELQAAVVMNPHLASAQYQLAISLLAIGKLSEAREQFYNNCLQGETSDDPSVLCYLGRIDLLKSNLDSSLAELKRISSSPSFPDTAHYLGCAY